jgi:hypothetical protein
MALSGPGLAGVANGVRLAKVSRLASHRLPSAPSQPLGGLPGVGEEGSEAWAAWDPAFKLPHKYYQVRRSRASQRLLSCACVRACVCVCVGCVSA